MNNAYALAVVTGILLEANLADAIPAFTDAALGQSVISQKAGFKAVGRG
jgi:hypothetical protein